MHQRGWAGWPCALLLAACAGKSPLRVDDLVALLPLAEVSREAGSVELGTPDARPHLTDGWYSNERSRSGERYVWSRGDVSVFEFFLAAPRDLRVEIRCAPLPLAGVRQAISPRLNGHPLGALELADGMATYAIRLPMASLVAGNNELEFRYRRVSEPSLDPGRRRLAVRWSALRFRPESPAAAEAPRQENGGLYLPFGSELVYYLEVTDRARLGLRRVDLRATAGHGGTGGGRLLVSARAEGGASRAVELGVGASQRDVDLPGQGSRLLRVALRAVASGPEGRGRGLWLQAPTVVASLPPRPPPRPAPAVKAAALARPGPARPNPIRPNVVLYLVDTLRADRLGCYGGKKAVSPALDAFVRGATLFERAVAQSSWTRPSVASVLTGMGPLAHGVQTLDDRLPEAAVTLPEMLQAAGYRTAGFSTNPQVSAATGLAQGFDDFALSPAIRSDDVTRLVVRWLDRRRGRQPCFLYVHTSDPHAPYDPPLALVRRFAPGVPANAGSLPEVRRAYAARGRERARRAAQLSDLYDGEVAGNDHGFGELLAALRARGLYDDSLIVFVADHGEEFDEHGDLGHGNNLYAETLNVPLIVKWPRQTRGERVAAVAQQLDLLPTVLRAAQLEPPRGLPGTDLRLLGAAGGAERRAFSSLSYDGREGVSLVAGGWKLILPLSRKFGAAPELFASSDRAEQVNLAERQDVRAGWLTAQIRLELLRGGRAPAAAPIDDETKRALAALGYL
jgi:choline-sulfatase